MIMIMDMNMMIVGFYYQYLSVVLLIIGIFNIEFIVICFLIIYVNKERYIRNVYISLL